MTYSRTAVLIGSALIILSGCAAPPAARGPAMTESPAITFYERSESAPAERRVQSAEFPARLDYKSELRIAVDRDRLSGGAADVLPPLTQQEGDRLALLRKLVQTARTYLAEYDVFDKQFRDQMRRPPSLRDAAGLAQAIKRQADAGLAVQLPLRDYLRLTTPGPAERAAANQAIFPPGVVLDLNALIRFVAAESGAIVDQARRDAARLAANPTKTLRVRATLFGPDGSAKPVHVEGYDRLEDANVVQEPRVATEMSPGDRDRISKELAVTKDVAQLVNDVRDRRVTLDEELARVTTALRGDLKAWTGTIDPLVQKLDATIAALGAARNANDPVLAPLMDSIKKFETDVTAHRDVLAAVRGAANVNADTDPVGRLLNAADAINGAVSAAQQGLATLARDVPATVAALTDLGARLAALDPANANVKALAAAVAPQALRAVKDAVAGFEDRYPALSAALSERVAAGRKTQAAADLARVEADPNLLDVDVRMAGDGKVYLSRNVVGGDRKLRAEAALIDRPKTDSPADVSAATRTLVSRDFAVEKYGFYSTWSTDLIFVNRFGDGDNGNRFSAAPSVSWNLHYNPPPHADGTLSPGEQFVRGLSPGVGVNVAALNLDDGVGVGLGGQLSVFNDLIQVGAGYDLNADHDNGYFFVGVSLFELFNRAGAGSIGR